MKIKPSKKTISSIKIILPNFLTNSFKKLRLLRKNVHEKNKENKDKQTKTALTAKLVLTGILQKAKCQISKDKIKIDKILPKPQPASFK